MIHPLTLSFLSAVLPKSLKKLPLFFLTHLALHLCALMYTRRSRWHAPGWNDEIAKVPPFLGHPMLPQSPFVTYQMHHRFLFAALCRIPFIVASRKQVSNVVFFQCPITAIRSNRRKHNQN
jgi:hypothetical protein